jgi:Putative Ig domain
MRHITRRGAVTVGGFFLALTALLTVPASRSFATAFGTLSNFDVVNDTSHPCHGFEIELEDVHPADVPYTFGGSYIRYGVPEVLDTTVDPSHPRVLVRYRHWNGSQWEETPVAPPNVTPGGHDCYAGGPIGNYQTSGCEHYGVSLSVNPTKTTYRWLVAANPADVNSPFTVEPQTVNIPVPVWNVAPAPVAAGGGVNVRAELEPIEEANPAQYGEPQWMKVFKVESDLDLQPEDLVRLLLGVAGGILPDETEIETEWKLIQSKPGNAEGAEEDADVREEPLGAGKHSVIRRYEFYRYTGLRDPENNEALPCVADDTPVPDDAPVDGCSDLGEFTGAQNAAVDVDLATIDGDLPPGEVGVPYTDLALVLGGLPPYVITVTGNAVPDGLALDPTTGVLSGTPTTDGVFSFTIHAEDAAAAAVDGTFDATVVPAVAIDTAALPTAVVDECYAAVVTASGGLQPFTWADVTPDLPAWAFTGDGSDVGGCPAPGDEGVSHVTFKVTDSLGGMDAKMLDLTVVAASPSATPMPTATPTPTDVPAATPTPTDVPAATPTATDVPVATPTATDMPVATPTATDVPAVATPTPTDVAATPTPAPALRLAKLMLKPDTSDQRDNGGITLKGTIDAGAGIDTTTGMSLAIADAGALDESYEWTGPECVLQKNGIKCVSEDKRLQMKLGFGGKKDPPGTMRVTAKLAKLDLVAPFSAPVTVTIGEVATGIARVGSIAACKTNKKGALICNE